MQLTKTTMNTLRIKLGQLDYFEAFVLSAVWPAGDGGGDCFGVPPVPHAAATGDAVLSEVRGEAGGGGGAGGVDGGPVEEYGFELF